MNIFRKISMITLLVMSSYFLFTACTIIRYVDPNEKKNNKKEIPPKVADMLVLVDLGRASTNLTEDYGGIIGTLEAALVGQNIVIRKMAIAPMYGRSEGVVPLVYGLGDTGSEFTTPAQAMLFYARDNGSEYLTSRASSDIGNLATLGKELDQRAIYHPTTADPEAIAYYTQPKDGLIVVHLSATPRLCSASDSACSKIEGMPYSTYFTQEVDDKVTWLKLPGGTGLPAHKIFHLVVATQEGINYADFHKKCTAYPNFPATKLDVMEPSENVFFKPFVDEINRNGGEATFLDLCEAMSAAQQLSIAKVSVSIRQAISAK